MSENSVYHKIPLENIINIESLVTIFYFEFAKDYVFKGEKHDFWEFLYVDKGEVEIMADTRGYRLEQGDIVFHKPNEFHSVWANGKIAPNIVVMSFDCKSLAMRYFENKILKLSPSMRNLLSEIIKEASNVFSNDIKDSYEMLVKRDSVILGSEQLLKIYLEAFLIKLIREDSSTQNKERLSTSTKERMEDDIINNIIEYMQDNIDKDLSFDDICTNFYIGKTHLKTIFKNAKNQGVMSYFRMLKMEEAKKLIREGEYNFTQIANMLGYDSVHYFSRCFKNYMNMSPSEYAVSVRARAEI